MDDFDYLFQELDSCLWLHEAVELVQHFKEKGTPITFKVDWVWKKLTVNYEGEDYSWVFQE